MCVCVWVFVGDEIRQLPYSSCSSKDSYKSTGYYNPPLLARIPNKYNKDIVFPIDGFKSNKIMDKLPLAKILCLS